VKVYCQCKPNDGAYCEVSRERTKKGTIQYVHHTCRKPTKTVWNAWKARCPECLGIFSSPWETICKDCWVDSGKPLSTYRSWSRMKLLASFSVQLTAFSHFLNVWFGRNLFLVSVSSSEPAPSDSPSESPYDEAQLDVTLGRQGPGPVSVASVALTI
jgi:hypothetical protein